MEMQSFNLHTHTYRCGHAVKDENDYILAAIESGFEVLGFSEHCGFENYDDDRNRMPFAMMKDYKKDIDDAKEKNKKKIKIYTGLEFEFFEEKIAYYEELKKEYDYMIIGQHLKDTKYNWYHDKCTDKDVRYMAYQVCMALEYGFSKYVAHPDYFMLARDTYSKECEKAVREIVQTAKKVGAVVEVNLKGMRYVKKDYGMGLSYVYPNRKTIQIYKEENADVVCGYDAHKPDALREREYETKIKQIIGEGVNYITDYRKILFER